MTSLTIKAKIWVSFGILLVIMVAVGAITILNLQENKKKLVELVSEVQPALVLSLNLIGQLDRAAGALGFYLLSKEKIHQISYLENLKSLTASIEKLQVLPIIKRDPDVSASMLDVSKKINKLQSYRDHMLTLAIDNTQNIPAIKFASVSVFPQVQLMFQNLQEMLMSEEEEEATPKRKMLLIEISEVRHTLSALVNELRIYLAFRADAQLDNFTIYTETLKEKLVRLNNTYDEDFLTFEQFEALQNFNATINEYYGAIDKLIEIHKGEGWRQDAFIIRTEISPLLLSIQESLTMTATGQQQRSLKESANLTRQAYVTQLIIGGLMGAGLLAAIIIGFLLSNAINRPIAALKESATQLALGNLDQDIDTNRKDELGSLAKSFADMRDSIRKKIKDLHVLNSTGEDLAGMYTQADALQISLEIMGKQTHISWGSVYLLNKENSLLEVKAYHPKHTDEPVRQAKTFEIGEGIAGHCAESQKIIYIADTTDAPDFVHLQGFDEPRAIVCVPLIDNDKVFGVMNFCGEVGQVKFEDSDYEFAENVARMTVVTSKNIAMLNVIEEQNKNLEKKVLERTSELRKKTNDINNMLHNMHQGIFTLVEGNKAHSEYSSYLENILETKEVAGANVMDLLFTNTDIGSNNINQIMAALDALIGEDIMMFECNSHLLVTEYKKTMSSGATKILELEWDPIIGLDGDTIEKLMVTVRDVTELRGLQDAAEEQKWELEVIGQILAVSREKFKGFIESSHSFISENEKNISAADGIDVDNIATLFRNMHTIKGNARTYGFSHLTDSVHEAENSYDQIRKNEITEWQPEVLLAELDKVKQLVDTYDQIYTKKLAANEPDGVFLDKALFDGAVKRLNNVDSNNTEHLSQTVNYLQSVFAAVRTESVSSMLSELVTALPGMAKDLGKNLPTLVVNDNDIRITAEVSDVLKDILTHEIRNSIDHGIESNEERKANGKSESGTITLDVQVELDKLILRLFDDGRGLALNNLRKKAVAAGIVNASKHLDDEQVAELMFESGLSTAGEINDISGRGVGMDAVRRFAQKIGGDIEIHFTADAKNEDYRPFESRIILPASYSVKVA